MHGLVILDDAGAGDPPVADLVRSAQPAAGGFRQREGRPRERAARTSRTPCSPASRCPNCSGCATTSRANFERVRKMLLPKDYVRFRLTGEFATEVSDASGTARVRRGEPALVVRDDGRARARPRAFCPSATNRARSRARSRREVAELTGLGGGHAGGGRRRRSGGERGRQRHRRSGHRLLHAGHVGRGVRAHGEGGVRSGRPRPHVLPRGARQVARDGRHAGRGPQPAMVPQSTRARRGLRRADGRSGARRPPARRACSGCRT